MTTNTPDPQALLTAAARRADIDTADAQMIRDGSNVLYRLAGGVVARIGRPGTAAIAEREVRVSRWLESRAVPVVHALDDRPQPVIIDEHPVTWWRLLPEHRAATPAELGAVLRALHGLAVPEEVDLPRFDPFTGLDPAHLDPAQVLSGRDHTWLVQRLADLREQYQKISETRPVGLLHGDAWQGNVAVPEDGAPIVLDLEKVALGPREVDLVSMAVDYTDFARISSEDYAAFVTAYGDYDVTDVPDYRTLAEIQELRWMCFTLSKAATRPGAAKEGRHRIRCLRGDIPRPWTWSAF